MRTLYYRLLRLVSLNIHPLFVFDGPNKPLFKRNKRVGGPGVRVATVPEFLAKQLLKQFGFPMHIAPGEAEAECALLQREGLVDAVLSDDVDTIMFGSGLTLRNWTAERRSTTPTHVDVYRTAEVKESSGLDREGMVLVALMSGGDYIPEGIPGCGPKFAVDAARAGFGQELCALGKKDQKGLANWREKLQLEITTNASKFFSRKNGTLTIPQCFPDREVFGYYTNPCVSTPEKINHLRDSLTWDHALDFQSLRSFAADAFDWRNRGGAKKFIRNLAPAMFVRELRLIAERGEQLSQEAQELREEKMVTAIHSKRNHATVDGSLEVRVSFVPAHLVPIDLTLESEDDEFTPAGGADDAESDAESELAVISMPTEMDNDAPESPSKRKRAMRPYDPDEPEKLWVLREWLQLGCPMLLEDFEASQRDPRAFCVQRAKARAAAKGDAANHRVARTGPRAMNSRNKQTVGFGMPANALMRHVRVTKTGASQIPFGSKHMQPTCPSSADFDNEFQEQASGFKLPSSQMPASLPPECTTGFPPASSAPFTGNAALKPSRSFAAFAPHQSPRKAKDGIQNTPPRRKRRIADLSTPRAGKSTITNYFSPNAKRTQLETVDVIDLVSSPLSNQHDRARALTPSPSNIRNAYPLPNVAARRASDEAIAALPDTVSRRRRRGGLRKSVSAPVAGEDDVFDHCLERHDAVECLDLVDTSPAAFNAQYARRARGDDLGAQTEAADLPVVNPVNKSIFGQSSLPTPPVDEPSDDELPDFSFAPARLNHTANSATEFMDARPQAQVSIVAAPAARSHPSKEQPSNRGLTATSEFLPAVKQIRHAIKLRESLDGAWAEVEAEIVDLTGDGSSLRSHPIGPSRRKVDKSEKAELNAWRKSGVEVLDMTGR